MKKTALFILAAFGLAVFTTGCQFQFPQKISVKTDAEYNFSLMNIEKDLNEFISVDKLSSMIPSAANMKVYDYNPGGNSKNQQYLMEVPIGNAIDLDFSTYFNQDLLNGNPIELTQSFSIPQVSIQKTGTQSLSRIGSKLSEAVKIAGPAIAAFTVPTISLPDFGFSSLSFSAGTLVIYTDVDAGTVTVSQAGGVNGSGTLASCTPVSKTAGDTSFTANYKTDIPLSGQTLKNNGTLQVSFTGTATYFYMEVEGGTLSSADGVRFSISNSDVSPSPETIPDPLPAMVKSLKIGTGSISTLVTPPSGWTGCSTTLKVKTSGLIDQSEAVSTINLNGKTLEKGTDLTVTPEFSLSFSNAHLDFSNSDLTYEVKTSITNIAEAVLDKDELFGGSAPSISNNIDLPSAVTNIVKNIKLGKSTIKVESSSDLPSGNDITVGMKCDFLNLDDSFVFGNNKNLNGAADPSVKRIPPQISFSGTVKMPSEDSSGVKTYTTFKNLVPGKTYNIKLKATPNIVWEEMQINTSTISDFIPSTPIETGIKFADLISALPADVKAMLKTVKLKEVPAYIYVSKPDLSMFDSISLTGSIVLTDGVEAHKVTLGSAGSALELKNIPVLSKNGNVVVSKLSSADSTLSGDLKNLLAFDDTDPSLDQLKVTPSITIGGAGAGLATVVPSDLTGKTSLKVVAYIVLPVDLSFESTPDLDLMTMLGLNDKDVFMGALSSVDASQLNDYLDVIESIEVALDVSKIPLEFTGSSSSDDLQVAIELFPNNVTDKGEHKLTLKNPKINLSGEEIKKILNGRELKPSVKIEVPDGNMTVSRAMSLGAVVNLKIKTNGKITVFDQVKK